jgi:hypothetical protein
MHRPIGMPFVSSMAMLTQRSPWKTKSAFASYKGLLAATTHTEAHQAQHATPT